jgi:predicted MPP superfamily phosphohydrolase
METPQDSAQSSQPAAIKICRDKPGPRLQIRSARGFEWNRLELTVTGLHPALNGMRLLHLTDFHCRRWWDPAYDDLIARIRQNPPDMILFTGDFVESKRDARPALPTVRRLFSQFTSRLGTFAIVGNHDGDLVPPTLNMANLTFVDHRRIFLESGDAAIELIGLPGVWRQDLDLNWAKALGKKRPGMLRIAMCHFPDLLPVVADLEPDLYLTGHTHGGQITWPSGLPIFRHDSLPRELCTGIHSAFGTVMVVNRGIGFSSLMAVRMFCPSEVIQIQIRARPI